MLQKERGSGREGRQFNQLVNLFTSAAGDAKKRNIVVYTVQALTDLRLHFRPAT